MMVLRGKHAVLGATFGLVLLVAGALVISADPSPVHSSPAPVMQLEPTSISLTAGSGETFTVFVVIQDATDLGAFEFRFEFDSQVVDLLDIQLGPFLGSTGRPVTCLQLSIISEGIVEFGCGTTGAAPPGANGSGQLASIDLRVIGQAPVDSLLRLNSCIAGDVLGASHPLNGCKDTKLTLLPSAPTATPFMGPSFEKLPGLSNLFLTRQGVKIPPASCLDGTDAVALNEALDVPIAIAPDPKDPSQDQQVGAFNFEVKYDQDKVCIEVQPGTAADAMTCFIEDYANSQLEGVARIGCVTLGKSTFPDTTTPAGRHLATIIVRPQPNEYSINKPNQDNGNAVQILNVGCQLSDLHGHPIKVQSCDGADVTIRYLEGDVNPDCAVNALDAAAIASRWGADKGSLLYADFMNLEPTIPADQDIDINDIQFVFGRFGSTCANPHPPQDPVNPKGGGPTPTPAPMPTPTPVPGKPRINTAPTSGSLELATPPGAGTCEDGPDSITFNVLIKDPITSEDPKDPTALQELGAFAFDASFDPTVVCIEVAPGEIPQGEMACFKSTTSTTVRFGCTTSSGAPQPQPPGVLATVTVRPHPSVYSLLGPSETLNAVLSLANCGLADLLGHDIKHGSCAGATFTIGYP